MDSFYEVHHYDEDFPIVLYADVSPKKFECFHMHWHEHMELLLITEGSMNVILNSANVTAQSGDVVVINSNVFHSTISQSENCRYHCLIVDKNFCEKNSMNTEDMDFENIINSAEIKRLYLEMVGEVSKKEMLYKELAASLLMQILIIIYRQHSKKIFHKKHQDEVKHKIIKQAIHFINTNYHKKLNLNLLCAEINVSKYYLCHTFKELTGITITEYINSLRCNHAKRLLKSGSYNVSQSAYLSGFNNISYFSKVFKECFGILPSEA